MNPIRECGTFASVMIWPDPIPRQTWRDGRLIRRDVLPPHLSVFVSNDPEEERVATWPLPPGWQAHLITAYEAGASAA